MYTYMHPRMSLSEVVGVVGVAMVVGCGPVGHGVGRIAIEIVEMSSPSTSHVQSQHTCRVQVYASTRGLVSTRVLVRTQAR